MSQLSTHLLKLFLGEKNCLLSSFLGSSRLHYNLLQIDLNNLGFLLRLWLNNNHGHADPLFIPIAYPLKLLLMTTEVAYILFEDTRIIQFNAIVKQRHIKINQIIKDVFTKLDESINNII